MAIVTEMNASSVFDRLGKVPHPTKIKTCKFWLQGRCNRIPCPFLHTTTIPPPAPKTKQLLLAPKTKKQLMSNQLIKPSNNNINTTNKRSRKKMAWRNNNNNPKNRQQEPDSRKIMTSSSGDSEVSGVKSATSDLIELMKEEIGGSSSENTQPSQCQYESGLTKLAELKGHTKAITGIALPSDSTKLYSVSKDKFVYAWDGCTGQCAESECLNDEVRCIITRGSWLFTGLQNNIKAWNLQHKVVRSINGTGGLVHSLEFCDDTLFAGMEDGSILVWRGNPDTSEFEPAAMSKGHTGLVHSLIIAPGHDKLYSGSADYSIKVWDQHLQCIQTLHGHTGQVKSLLCFDKYLLSASLDKTLKVWSATDSGTTEMVYEHKADHAFMSMGGIMDRPEAQHILICSLEDNSVRLYDFPSFIERGRVSSKAQASVIQLGHDGVFFSGDEAGEISVWRLA